MPEGVTTFVRIKFVNLKLTITLQRPCHVPQHAIDLCPNTERNVRRKEKLTILGRKKLTILVVEVRDLSSSISASVQKSRVIYSERWTYLGDQSTICKSLVDLASNVHRRRKPFLAVSNSSIRHGNSKQTTTTLAATREQFRRAISGWQGTTSHLLDRFATLGLQCLALLLLQLLEQRNALLDHSVIRTFRIRTFRVAVERHGAHFGFHRRETRKRSLELELDKLIVPSESFSGPKP